MLDLSRFVAGGGLGVGNRTVSLVLFGGCVLAAAVFYRNLTLFTGAAATRVQLRAVRAVTVFNLIFVAGLFAAIALCQDGLPACRTAGASIQSWGIVTISALLLWVGIPGVLSLIFFWKKVRGKL